MKLKSIIFALLLALLVACGPPPQTEEAEPEAAGETAAEVETAAEEAEEPTEAQAEETEAETETDTAVEEPEETAVEEPEEAPTLIPAPDDLVFNEIEAGEGDTPAEGEFVQLHFIGQLDDGTEFANSYEAGNPVVIPVGENAIMPAWDMALMQMRPGGKAEIIVPPELGFGEQGAGSVIPPNAVLRFELELLSIPEIEYEELEAGEGVQPGRGDFVQVHYIGTLDDGTEFDNSYERGEPITFELGGRNVIPGWHLGIEQMNVGGKAILTIPPALGYGSQGTADIPPDSTLTFEVELVDIATIEFEEIEEGTGELPEEGDLLSVHYVGTLEDGTEFDNSRDRGEPLQIVLGAGQVIPGWEQGLAMMKEGGKARLTIPPELAYGAQGAGGVIPPNATLIFEVELVEIEEQ